MNNFGFKSSTTPIRDYQWLRCITLVAGGFGLVQSLIWIGLTITSILCYNCIIGVEPNSYGSLVGLVFVELYFRGSCTPNGMLGYDWTLLKSVDTVQDPQQIFIWSIVYLVVAVCWLLVSFLLLTQLDKEKINLTCGLILSWSIVTLCIIILDTVLGVFFAIDFERFHSAALNYNFSTMLAGAVNPSAAQLMAGYVVALYMMFISFKGLVLFLINVALVIYFLLWVARIIRDNDTNDTLFIVRKNSDNILDRSPIAAFDEPNKSTGYVNGSYMSESIETVELNHEAIVRAARMSNDVSTMDRRFRNLESYQQYPPPRASNQNAGNNNNNNGNSNNNNNNNNAKNNQNSDSQFPAPDYTPPMSRAYRGYQ